MAETDSPLKQLVDSAIADFASWLLDAEIESAYAVNIELPGDLVRVDQLFRVTLKNGHDTLFHIEFQGKSTHRPMKWRMLEYMSRMADAQPELDLFSTVFYVGQGAGATDTGTHQVNAPDGALSIQWKYQVVHLWKMQARTLLALRRPGLLPLIGQTQIEDPQVVIPQVIESLKQVENEKLQQRLLTSLAALVEDEEIATMVEKLIEQEELLMDTPFLRRIRQAGKQEGRQEGRQEGVEIGRQEGIEVGRHEGRHEGQQEGIEKGRVQGAISMRRQAILDALILRFDPVASVYREIEKAIANLNDDATLDRLFASAIKAATLADFQATLQQAIASPEQGPA